MARYWIERDDAPSAIQRKLVTGASRLIFWSLICFVLLGGITSAYEESEGTILTADPIDTPITLDGIADEGPWNSANPLTVRVKDGGIGTVDIVVRALYDEEHIYISARWPDTAENASKGVWTYNATTGSWSTSENEDRIAFMWNNKNSIRNFNIAGCVITCHGDRKYVDNPSGEADMWHWKAARSNPLDYCDDKFLNNTLIPYEGSEDKLVARFGDNKQRGGYKRNINDRKTGPRYYEPHPTDDRDALFLMQSEIDDGDAIEITDENAFGDGAAVPGYILERPIGSRGDIDAKGVWSEGYWEVEFKRKLVTGQPHDVQFDTTQLYRFGIAVMDNEGGFISHGKGHSFGLDAKTLEFGGLGSETVTHVGLVRDHLITAKVYVSRGDVGLATSEVNYALTLFSDIIDEVASLDPELYIHIKEDFTTAKRSPSVENIDDLIGEVDNLILTLQGKRTPTEASLSQTLIVIWGKIQPYVFIIIALLALFPIYKTWQTGQKPIFRKLSFFIFLVITPILLEGVGRLGMVLGVEFLYGFSFMTSEYATFLWVLLMVLALFFARAGFGEVDKTVQALESHRTELENRVKERTEELTVSNEQLELEIVERRRAESELKKTQVRYRNLIENALDGINIVDRDGNFTFVNQEFCRMLGYTQDELMGQSFVISLQEEDRESALNSHKTVLKEHLEPFTYVGKMVHKDGSLMEVQTRWNYIYKGDEVDGTMAIARDITKFKEAEEAIQNYTSELEESNSMKELFLDILRHDLLNPLGVIDNVVTLIQDEGGFEDYAEDFQVIKRNIKKQSDIIKNASLLAKVENIDELEKEKIDLNDMIHSALSYFETLTSEKRITIRFDPENPHLILANPIIEDVLSNIISNSLKYSPDNTNVDIDILDDDPSWKIAVKDQGEGIEDEDKAGVFERFKRTGKGAVKGTGLGLAIVKSIVELHGGTVWVEDNPSGGSIFYVRLPKGGVE